METARRRGHHNRLGLQTRSPSCACSTDFPRSWRFDGETLRFAALQQMLRTTNINGGVERYTRNVQRWARRADDPALGGQRNEATAT